MSDLHQLYELVHLDRLCHNLFFHDFCCRVIGIGDLVETPYGQGVVIDCVRAQEGFREFLISIFDNQQIVKLNRLALNKIGMMDEFDDEIDMPDLDALINETEPEPMEIEGVAAAPLAQGAPKGRFAKIKNQEDVDDLAEECNAKLTKSQMRWAVRIFRGELHISLYLDCLHLQQIRPTAAISCSTTQQNRTPHSPPNSKKNYTDHA